MDVHHSWWNHTGHSRVVLYVSVELLIFGSILYLWNQTSLKRLVDYTFVHSYMNDCLAGVTLISYVNLLCLVAKKPTLCLISPLSIVGFMFTVGLFWEFVTPLYWADSVCDAVDLFAYVVGGITYWTVMKVTEHLSGVNQPKQPG